MKNRPAPTAAGRPRTPGARRVRRPSTFALTLIIASFASTGVGCGGSVPSRSVRSTPAEASGSADAAPTGGALSAQLARTLPADAASTALVSFAVFRPQAVDDIERQQKVARGLVKATLRLPPQGLNAVLRRPMPDPEVIIAAVDGDLPLDLPALVAEAGPAAPAIEQAKSVWIVRYAGAPMDQDAHLRAAAVGAWAFAHEGAAVVDLGTRRAWSRDAYLTWLKSDGWLADQVTVSAEQGEDGAVTFFTRGMARFGQPDLEAADVPPEKARETFAAFQTLLAALREHGPAKAGDTVGGVELGACTRPPEAIERACVSM